jgi:hypothetical protein
MTCRDFEGTWNELLDAETRLARAAGSAGVSAPSLAEREQALSQHASECAACAKLSTRYQVLRRAIRAWAPPPAPSAALADRIITEMQAPPRNAWAIYRTTEGPLRRSHVLAAVAAGWAAVLVIAVVLPRLNRSMNQALPLAQQIAFHNTPSDAKRRTALVAHDARGLNLAFAEATAATWDLARSASEPAARISRDVLDAATKTDETEAEPASITSTGRGKSAGPVPSLDSLVPDAAAGAVLQQVSDHFAEGVRPLSDTARQAFGFLRAPTIVKPEVRFNSPAQKGA